MLNSIRFGDINQVFTLIEALRKLRFRGVFLFRPVLLSFFIRFLIKS